MSDKMLSLSEACEVLGVSETTLKRQAKEHLIKSIKTDDLLEFPEADLLKYKEINDRFKK
ncbi:MAG: excisionase family DNA binding protein [Crocinitomicaceae bacterium]|jgi:excisionase family DNA binding protein